LAIHSFYDVRSTVVTM